jgi:hypothetical protein
VARTVRFDVLAVAKATGFEDADRKIERLSGTAKKSTSGLLVAAAALAPAMVPIAAAATAAGASFVALGAVGVLAFLGIKKEMAAGTPTGKAFTATIGTLKRNVAELENTASRGVLTGFQSSVKSLQPLIPLVNRDTAQLSAKLGDIVSHVMPGLVGLFTTANPLLLGFADDLDRGAKSFERWATSSDGAKRFVAYAQAQLPKVEQFFGSLATTVGHLAQGFAPLGGFILSDLTAFSKLVNAIPIPVLKVAAPLVLSLVVAMKAMAVASLIAPKIALLTGSLKGLVIVNALAGGSMLGLAAKASLVAAAIAGVVIGYKLLSSAFTDSATNFARSNTATQNLVEAFTKSRGAIDANVKSAQQMNLESSGIAARAANAGISMDQLSTALTGPRQGFDDLIATWKRLGDPSVQTIDAFRELRIQMFLTQEQTGAAASAFTTMLGAQVKAGITTDGVTTTIDKQTTAAGLLKNALDRLNGASLGVEDTQNQFLDTLAQLKKAQDAGTRSIAQNSEKGRVNREVIVSAIKAANDHAQAVATQTAKTKGLNAGVTAGAADFKAHEAAIRRAAAAAGLDADQVSALIKKLGKVPKNIVTAINIRDKASAQFKTIKQNLAALKSKQIDITTYIKNVILPTVRTQSGSHDSRIRDAGGPVTKNEPYIIGLNRRPEIFVPEHSGRIYPVGSGAGRMSAGGTTINLTVQAGVIANPTEFRRLVIGELERAFRDGETVAGGQRAMR